MEQRYPDARKDTVYVLAVVLAVVLIAVGSVVGSGGFRSLGSLSSVRPGVAGEGLSRTIDVERFRRLIHQGQLSDREGEYYRVQDSGGRP